MTPEEQRAYDQYYRAAIPSAGFNKYGDAIRSLKYAASPPPRVKTHLERRMDALDDLLDDK